MAEDPFELDPLLVYGPEKVKRMGFHILEEDGKEPDERGVMFDRIAGQAALCGTLTIPLLLQFIRPYVVQQEVPDLDTFAHMILDL